MKTTQNKTNLSDEKKLSGAVSTGTINDWATPPNIKNKQRSTKLSRNTMKIYDDEKYNKIK